MPSLSIPRHPSAADSPWRVTQARLRVLRRIVFAAAQVAALFFDGFLLQVMRARIMARDGFRLQLRMLVVWAGY